MAEEMKNDKYPIGIQTFAEVRESGCYYVDKTRFIPSLLKNKYYFLSRPRRFGKSLFLSTLRAYFEGKRELFRGLAADRAEGLDWEPRPVLYIDLNAKTYEQREDLLTILDIHLRSWEKHYGIEALHSSPDVRFAEVIRRAHEREGRKVAILVDEYDKPLISALGNDDLQAAYRSILKGFYGNLKSSDAHIAFAMLTGVTRFSKVSIFSDLNNLYDISLAEEYADICGITEGELLATFSRGIASLGEKVGKSVDETVGVLRRRYDGYRFASDDASARVYNPFSVLCALRERRLGSYWFATGTPTFLIDMLRRDQAPLSMLERAECSPLHLAEVDQSSSDPVPMLFQTGYLTIKGYNADYREDLLGYPNEEVREAFVRALGGDFLHNDTPRSPFDIRRFREDVLEGDPERFMVRLNALFANVPYDAQPTRELHFENTLYLVFTILGFTTRAEVRTSATRADMVVETDRYVYVFESKFDKPSVLALLQIDRRAYTLPYSADGRRVFKIGATYLSASASLEWSIETMNNE